MSWYATDDRFPFHSKRVRLMQYACHDSAVALWILAGAWCSGQDGHSTTGFVPDHMLSTFGVSDPQEAAAALVDVGLWEPLESGYGFHDWAHWNGPDAKVNRSRAKTRERVHAKRLRDCEAGQHSKNCPKIDLSGDPWICEQRHRKSEAGERVTPRNATPGRAGSGRAGSERERLIYEEGSTGVGPIPLPDITRFTQRREA